MARSNYAAQTARRSDESSEGRPSGGGYSPLDFKPVDGSRKSLPLPPPRLSNENRFRSEPALVSKEKLPILPVSQLSSMNRSTELWSVTVWSTKLDFAKGEITRSGWRGP